MEDLATFQSLAGLVFRVCLKQRPHPVGHPHQFLVTLVAKRLHVRPAITGFVDGITVEKLAEAIDKEINTQITESA